MRRVNRIISSLLVFLTIMFSTSITFCAHTPVILDNAGGIDNGVLISGSWTTSTWQGGGNFLSSNYIHDGNTGKGEKSVKFAPILTAGNYSIYIRYTSSSNRANNVPLDITHAGIVDSHVIDQTTGGEVWQILGTYAFAGTPDESVTIKNDGTNGYVIVDGVAFVSVSQGTPCLENIVAYWTLDDGQQIILDNAGANIGWVNGVQSIPGQVGNALSFDGNDYVSVADAGSLRLTEKFTLTAWVKETGTNSYAKILSRRNGNYFYFLGVDNGKPYAGIGDGNSYTVSDKSFSVPLNEWHHLAVTFNTNQDKMLLYYDGQLKEVITVTKNLSAMEGVALTIGADKQGTGHFFTGVIDEAAIFNRALDETEIQNLFIKGLNSLDLCVENLCGNGQVDLGEDCDGGSDCPGNCQYPECYTAQIINYTPGLRKDGQPIPVE